jgi:eukaryotic translation initiation factor 2C
VQRVENQFQVELKKRQKSETLGLEALSLSGESDWSMTVPPRPGYGSTGKPIKLLANYVEMKVPKDLALFEYSVKAVKANDPKRTAPTGRKLERVIKLFLQSEPMQFARGRVATDFRVNMVTSEAFPDRILEQAFRVTYLAEDADEPPQKPILYDVTISKTMTGQGDSESVVRQHKILNLSTLLEYICSIDPSAIKVDNTQYAQALNIFLNHYSKISNEYVAIGKNKSFPLLPQVEDFRSFNALKAIRGFFSSVRPMTARILVNINVSNGAFYDPIPLLETMKRFWNRDYRALEQFLKLVRVETKHIKTKSGKSVPRVKTIFGLATPRDGKDRARKETDYKAPKVPRLGANAKEVEFWLNEESKYISVQTFFKQRYNVTVNAQVPVVNVGSINNPTYLPADVCRVTEGQYYNRLLDPQLTDEMIKFAVRNPPQNLQSIVTRGFQTTGLHSGNPLLKTFGITVNQTLITVAARILDMPHVLHRKSGGSGTTIVQDAFWNFKDKLVYKAPTIKRLWNGLCICGPGSHWSRKVSNEPNAPTNFESILGKLQSRLRACGIDNVNRVPGRAAAVAYNQLKLEQTMTQEISKLFEHAVRQKWNLIFVVIEHPRNKEVYSIIKYLGDVVHGIHTVCVQAGKLNDSPGFLTNISLKVNIKLGGMNHTVDQRQLGLIRDGKTMVVGYDVTHPAPGSSDDAVSVAGMVASLDGSLAQWPATMREQRGGKEDVDTLEEMLKIHLRLWCKQSANKGQSPENILIFRDGVSEGQYQIVLQKELPQLQAACKGFYPGGKLPRFAIIVCGKRHHTRFYAIDSSGGDSRSGRTFPGTVVDRGVTFVAHWDFFLQSHRALQGTPRPAHYFVILDEIFREYYKTQKLPDGCKSVEDAVETLIHAMSYTFGRSTTGLSICPPARYADIVCDRSRVYIAKYQMDLALREGVTPRLEDYLRLHKNLEESMFYV